MGKLKVIAGGASVAAPVLDRPNPEEFQMIPLVVLVESEHNPRKHFHQGKLEELAESIRAKGVITPLIVRESKDFVASYEIGAGHRRYRAAKLAGIDHIPVRILDLDDQAFLELLTIENDQREDVHPLEQADGYRELLRSGKYANKHMDGYDVASMADRIGKTEAFVRGRLELCDLIPVVRESFLQDCITIGHARLLSRVPAAKQESSLEACFQSYGDRRLLTVTEFRHQLQRLMKGEDLSHAPFDLEDETLKSDAGACTNCPKCSDPQRNLIGDATGGLCLDGACYSQKLNAHIMRATAAGAIAISTKYSGDIKPGAVSAREYVEAVQDEERIEQLREEIEATREEVNDPEMLDPKQIKRLDDDLNKLRAELAEAEADTGKCAFSTPAIVVDEAYGGKIGKMTQICREPTCPVHGERVKENEQIYGERKREQDPKAAAAEEKKKRERKLDQAIRRRAWETLLGAVEQHGQVNSRVLYLAASGFLHLANKDFCKAFGIEPDKDDYRPAKRWIGQATEEQLLKFIVGAALARVGMNEFFDKEYGHKQEWQDFRDTLVDYEVSYKDIESNVRAEFKAAEAKKKAKAAKKAAKPKIKDGKRAAANDEDEDEE